MRLEKLTLLNFKNYEEVSVTLNPGINMLVGRNGSGKTNFLDAIYYLSFTKSAFTGSDLQCIRNGEGYFMIKGVFHSENREYNLAASVQNGIKKIFRENQRDYEKLSDHIGKYPAVLMAPDDTDLIREGSESRRKFFDGMISQIDRKYLDDLLQYNHALKQRNSLLKMAFETGRADPIALEAYDTLLIKHGEYIFRKRAEFISQFLPIFVKFFCKVVEEPEKPFLRYSSQLSDVSFRDGLTGSRQKDEFQQRTNFGVHRDDFDFILKDNEVKKTGSQGQQKSFVIALKLAQFEIIASRKGFKPLLLLDDIFDKLDDFRIKALIELIKSDMGQIFITDARPHRTSELLNNIGVSASTFVVESGRITLKEEK